MKTTKWLAVLTLSTAALAAPTAAQDKAGEAAALETRAEALAGTVDGFGEAASLFRKAAHMRLDGDPQGIRNLLKSGKLAYYVGQVDQAARDLAEAGEIALSYGDVMTAAQAFLDAAWAAEAAGLDGRAHSLATRAQKLAQSPLIESGTRFALLSRIDQGVGEGQ